MGLDTHLKFNNNDVAYWRKCYGLDSWLEKNSIDVDDKKLFKTKILKDITDKMKLYILKMIERINELGYYVNDDEDLRLICCDLYEGNIDEYNDYESIQKIIKSFSSNDLNFDTFSDSLWDPVNTFIQAYQGFMEAQNYEELELISSR